MKYGAACDNLISAKLVTVDGRQVAVGRNSNPDLFWAIRGGGAFFNRTTGQSGAKQVQLNSVDRGKRTGVELWIGGSAVVLLGHLCLLVLRPFISAALWAVILLLHYLALVPEA